MKLPPGLIVTPLCLVYKIWAATLRGRVTGRAAPDEYIRQGQTLLFCGWHDEIFSILPWRAGWPLAAIVSRSRDGDYMAGLLNGLGLRTVRGSSSRGGAAALLQAAAALNEDKLSTYVALDGPRGPRHEAKDGVFFLAYHTKSLLVPMRAFNARAWRAKSWDRFQVPRPFSRTLTVFGKPYAYEAPNLEKASLDAEREKLAAKMQELESLNDFAQ